MAEVKVMRRGKLVQVPTTAPVVVEIGMRGLPGGRGPKGDPGDAMTFEDLTEEQKLELKGDKGDKGDTPVLNVASAADIENLF